MSHSAHFHKSFELPAMAGELLLASAEILAAHSAKAFRVGRRAGQGLTLRPGRETPLWNVLRAQLKLCLRKRGAQANLGRILGLPRQRVYAFVTAGAQMPDAERTLQILVWLLAVRRDQRPA